MNPSGHRASGVRRWVALLSSMVMLACLGGVYAWSAFVPPLRDLGGLTAAQAQLVFGVGVLAFTVVMLGSGPAQERWSPRWVALLGGFLFGLGYLAASTSRAQFSGLLLGIGVLSGAGIGCAYISALATAMKWFPSHRGAVAGLTVAAFGSGAILLANGAQALFHRGFGVLEVFRLVGLGFGPLTMLCALLLFAPPPGETEPVHRSLSLRRVFASRDWRILSLGIFSGTFAGLLVIGNLKPIGLAGGVEPAHALHAITGFSVGNALGRLLWGWIVDRLGRAAISLSLAFLTAAVAALALPRLGALFPLIAALVGFGFGSCFVVYAAQVAERFGARAVGKVYPLVFISYGISGLTAPFIGGWFFDLWGTYLPAILTAAALTALAALLCWRLDTPVKGLAIDTAGRQ